MRVHLELWDKQYDLKTKSSDKENIGVELYNLQQKLADLQINFEKSHEKYNRYSIKILYLILKSQKILLIRLKKIFLKIKQLK